MTSKPLIRPCWNFETRVLLATVIGTVMRTVTMMDAIVVERTLMGRMNLTMLTAMGLMNSVS